MPSEMTLQRDISIDQLISSDLKSILVKPPDIYHLIDWCEYFLINEGLVSTIVSKLASYVVTNIIVESPDEKMNEKIYELLFSNDILENLVHFNAVILGYGNLFLSVITPFTRFLKCPKCNYENKLSSFDVVKVMEDYTVGGICPKCVSRVKFKVIDVAMNTDRYIFKIWDPREIIIDVDPLGGKNRYIYKIPSEIRNRVRSLMQIPLSTDRRYFHRYSKAKAYLETLDLNILRAIKEKKAIEFSPNELLHVRRVGIYPFWASGWGLPIHAAALDDLYAYSLLRKYSNYLARERTIPIRFIYPQVGGDVVRILDLKEHAKRVLGAFEQWRKNKSTIHYIPVPIGMINLGGEGAVINLEPAIKRLEEKIILSCNVPQEFVYGGLQWCLDPESYVYTDKGLLKLMELHDFQKIFTGKSIQHIAIVHRDAGIKPKYRVETKFGYCLEGSPDHKVYILDSELNIVEKKIEDLQKGDLIAFKAPNYWPQSPPKLDVRFDSTDGSLTFPDVLTEDLARLIGYLLSDSCTFSNSKIIFSHKNRELLDDFSKCCARTFNYIPKVTKQDDVYSVELPEQISSFLIQLVPLTSAGKEIPLIIRQAPKELMNAFLEVLFTCSGVTELSDRKVIVTYSSPSESFVRTLQLILLNYGIVAKLVKRTSTYELSLTGRDLILFLSEVNLTFESSIEESLSLLHQRVALLSTIQSGRHRQYVEFFGNSDNSVKETVLGSFMWLPVEKIEYVGECSMMDLTVCEDHTYVANGFVTHNSGSSISLRMLENYFKFLTNSDNRILRFILDKIIMHKELSSDYKQVKVRLASPKMIDDIQRQRLLVELNARNLLSDVTLLKELGFDPEHEHEVALEDINRRKERQVALAKAQAEANAEIMKEQAKSQVEAQKLTKEIVTSFGLPFEHFVQLPMEYQALLQRILSLSEPERMFVLEQLRTSMPNVFKAIQPILEQIERQKEEMQRERNRTSVDEPLPEKKPPRREERSI